MSGHRGFTLVEIMVCLFIVALLAAAVSLSLGGVNRVAQMQDTVERFCQYERLTRQQARRFGRATQLVFLLDGDQVVRVDALTQEPRGQAFVLPPGYRIDRVALHDRMVTDGQVAIPCSTRGQSLSYAARLVGPADQTRWVLFAGMTGQVTEVEDEAQLEKIFEVLRPQRDHTD